MLGQEEKAEKRTGPQGEVQKVERGIRSKAARKKGSIFKQRELSAVETILPVQEAETFQQLFPSQPRDKSHVPQDCAQSQCIFILVSTGDKPHFPLLQL